jgi:hypothetical protein
MGDHNALQWDDANLMNGIFNEVFPKSSYSLNNSLLWSCIS